MSKAADQVLLGRLLVAAGLVCCLVGMGMFVEGRAFTHRSRYTYLDEGKPLLGARLPVFYSSRNPAYAWSPSEAGAYRMAGVLALGLVVIGAMLAMGGGQAVTLLLGRSLGGWQGNIIKPKGDP